jgi:NADH-quinone oxidoreductase subunit N
LYGSSLIYGYSGVTNLKTLATVLKTGQDIPSIMKAGIAFIMAGLAFKISAAPFHVWTPDVYEGSPTPVTAFIASAPKIAGLALMVRVFSVAMGEAWPYWEILLAGIAMASMVVGSLGALYQKNIKRLLAYSAIGNMGYILTGIITGSVDGLTAGTIYIILYIVMITGIFACLLALNHRNRVPVLIDDLKGLVRAYPELSLVLCFLFFSLAGIPPLAGFLGKLYIFQSVIAGKFYVLAFVGILSSVVSAAYYLWLIKTILMDEPHSPYKFEPSRNHPRDPAITFVLTGIIVSLLGLFIFPDPLVRMASGAAASVMNNNYGRN